ncbi:hypothetical protein [Methanoculleus sp.]|jgi:hypothetical protein|uniref:hypothetical protein n=1 Tax=Methanoculleus sp. TaxID=90427 RepID=UPI0025E13E51|nr:hypothetical protein [Methanoculleus sp.]MCK9320035.1 hypothetical protein [Methanoculleus sp.]
MKVTGSLLATALDAEFKASGMIYAVQIANGVTKLYDWKTINFSSATSNTSDATIVTSASVSWTTDNGDIVNRLILNSFDNLLSPTVVKFHIDDTLTTETFTSDGLYILESVTVVLG